MKKIARRTVVGAAASALVASGAESGVGFQSWKIEELEAKRKESGRVWLQFFDNPTMYLGVYSLGAAASDGQGPHKEDEIYYVVSGRAKFRAGGEEVAVGRGSVLFVKAGVAHKFHSIEEPIELLVFFSKGKA